MKKLQTNELQQIEAGGYDSAFYCGLTIGLFALGAVSTFASGGVLAPVAYGIGTAVATSGMAAACAAGVISDRHHNRWH